MEYNKKELVEHQDTDLRLGLPGTQGSTNFAIKRSFQHSTSDVECVTNNTPPPPKAQVMGWPPIRSYRKNAMKKEEGGKYVKVSMDGAPYLRKIDMKLYQSYPQLLKALEDMFQLQLGKYSEKEGYNGEDVVATYEDKDGDWMLVGDVPWEMFINSCKRLRIMKGSEARGLASCLP